MGTKPVHAVLGFVLLSGVLASGCRTTDGGGGPPGMIGSNTPRPGAFGRDPGGIANAPASGRPGTSGQSPASVYGSDTNPTLAASASSPAGAVREYPNQVNLADNGTVSNSPSRSTGWNSSPRANTIIPTGGYTSGAPVGNPYGSGNPAAGISGSNSGGVTPANYPSSAPGGVTPANYPSSAPGGVTPANYPSSAPPGAVPTNYPNPPASAFPSGGRDAFREQPAITGTSMPATGTMTSSGSTMTITPGTTSGDIGRTTPAPQVDLPNNGGFHSVPASSGMPGQ